MIDLTDRIERLLKDEDVLIDAESAPLGLDHLRALLVEAVVMDEDEGANRGDPAISGVAVCELEVASISKAVSNTSSG
jgi:hypothetical protein